MINQYRCARLDKPLDIPAAWGAAPAEPCLCSGAGPGTVTVDAKAALWMFDTDANTYVFAEYDETASNWVYFNEPNGTLLAPVPVNVSPVRPRTQTLQKSEEIPSPAGGLFLTESALLLSFGGVALHSVDINVRQLDPGVTAVLTRGTSTDEIWEGGSRDWQGDSIQGTGTLFPASNFELTVSGPGNIVVSATVIL